MGNKNFNESNSDFNLENTIASFPGNIYWKDKGGVYLDCNDQQIKDLGLKSTKDIIGKTDYELPWKCSIQKIIDDDKEVMSSGVPKIIEDANRLSIKVPLRNSNIEIIGIFGLSIDTNKFNFKTEDDRDILEKIVAMMPGHVYWKDRNCVLLGCNNQQAIDSGLNSRFEVVGKTAYDLLWQDQPEEEKRKQASITDNIDTEIMDSDEAKIIEEFVVLPDKTTATYLSTKSPLHDKNNKVVGLVGISIDISVQKRLAEELEEKKVLKKQVEIAELIGAAVAHEVRTPLSAIQAITTCIKEAVKAGKLELITQLCDKVRVNLKSTDNFIDMFLKNLTGDKVANLTQFQIQSAVIAAIDRYPFTDATQRDLVRINTSFSDFAYLGEETLIIHVLFNLIKNSLYVIKKVNKGVIEIYTSADCEYNYLHFKDTAIGIAKDQIELIFDKFYSMTGVGTGIGLSFCKAVMESIQGNIKCDSVLGEFTEFKMGFPKIKVDAAI